MSIILQNKSGMAGRFQIEMHTADEAGNEIPGTRHVVAPWQNNLVTDSGLDNMHASGFMTHCRIGSGNSAPANGDTALQSHLASVSGTVVEGPHDAGEGWNSIVGTYVFGQGVGDGIIAELGVAPGSGNITTRALIKDEGGSPTTITKGPMDVLTVTYQMREYPDQGDTVEQITNPHTSQVYTVTNRSAEGVNPARLLLWHMGGAISDNTSATGWMVRDGVLHPWDGANRALSRNDTAREVLAYQAGDYYRDIRLTWAEGDGNIAGGIDVVETGRNIGSVARNPFFMQASFDPPIDKDNTKTLIITLRKSWGRHTP